MKRVSKRLHAGAEHDARTLTKENTILRKYQLEESCMMRFYGSALVVLQKPVEKT